jgi:hypothetical protein
MAYRSERGVGWLGLGGVSAALALGVAAYSERREDSPEAIFARNAIPHRCLDQACELCQAELEWLRANPGRTLADILDAAETGVPVTVSGVLTEQDQTRDSD